MTNTNRRWWAVALGSLLAAAGLFWLVQLNDRGVTFPPSRPLPTLSPEIRRIAIENNVGQDRPLQVIYQIETLASQQGWTPALHRQAGDQWAKAGDVSRAVQHWQIAAQSLDEPLLWRALASAYVDSGQWSQAVEVLEKLLALSPDDTWANYHLGMILASFDALQASTYLQQAALDVRYGEIAREVRITLLQNRDVETLDAEDLPVLVGLTMIELEVWPYAELALTHANDLHIAAAGNHLPQALAYISLAQNKQGKDGSDAIFEALRLSPDDPQIRFLQGLHYRHVGNYTASLGAMIQAVSLAPERPELYAELGTAYRLTGNLEQAERWYQAAVDFSGNDPQYADILALFYAEEAPSLGLVGVETLRDRLEDSPNQPDLLAGMGWAKYAAGDYEGGRADIEQALRADASNARANYYMARVLLGTGEDDARAIAMLEQVMDAQGAFSEDARRILDVLR